MGLVCEDGSSQLQKKIKILGNLEIASEVKVGKTTYGKVKRCSSELLKRKAMDKCKFL